MITERSLSKLPLFLVANNPTEKKCHSTDEATEQGKKAVEGMGGKDMKTEEIEYWASDIEDKLKGAKRGDDDLEVAFFEAVLEVLNGEYLHSSSQMLLLTWRETFLKFARKRNEMTESGDRWGGI